jgi:hypothetical protein
LNGKTAEYAQAEILKEFPTLNVSTLGRNSPMTMGYRTDRVRLIVDENKIVAVTPYIA